jgi:hypothetical protein
LSFVQSNGILERTGLWGAKALALLVVLVLSGGALLFAAGEAHAQQRLAPKADATVAGQGRTPLSESGLAEPAAGTLPAVSSPSQVGERVTGAPSDAAPYPAASGAPALELLEQLSPVSWRGPLPEAAAPVSFGVTFGPEPAYDPALASWEPGLVPGPWYPTPFVDSPPASGLTGFVPTLPYQGFTSVPAWDALVPEAYKTLASHIEGKPSLFSPVGTPEGMRPAPYQGNGVAEALPVGPLLPFVDRKAPPPGFALQEPPMALPVASPPREEALLLSSAEAAANGAVEKLYGAAADTSEALVPDDEASTENPFGGATQSPEDAPPPPSPPPWGSSYFSQSVGGQIGSGGVVPLLICVLVARLVLLRPLVGRLLWATSDLPKPSSVLLLPLERPG